MLNPAEQFATANKAGAAAFLAIAHAQFSVFERLSALNFNATKAAFEDGVRQAKTLLSVDDPQALNRLTTASAQPAMEKAISYSRNVYEVAAQAKAEVSKLVESQVSAFNKNVITLMEKVTENAPAGTDAGVAALKSVLAAASSGYDNFNKAMKQAADIAEANIAAATDKVVKATINKKAA